MMTIHVLGAIDATTHYGLEADRAIKNFSDLDEASWAVVARQSVLGAGPLSVAAQIPSPDCRRVVLRSGRLPGDDSGLAGSWAGWSPRGKAAFESEIDRLAPVVARLEFELILWPSAGDALSDIPSCLSFLRRYESGPFRLLIEPAALLAESMLPRAAEHLERIVDSLADHPGVAASMASNVEFHESRGECVPLGRGSISSGLIETMVSRLSATSRPLVVRDRDDATTVARLATKS